MKRNLWTGFVLVALTLTTLTAAAKKTVPTVYLYGMAMSLTDSVVYVTEVQVMERAELNAKTKFLEGRTLYSEQLRFYLDGKGLPTQTTCAVSYNVKKKKLEKEYQRMLSKLEKKKLTVKHLAASDFTFTPFDTPSDDETPAATK